MTPESQKRLITCKATQNTAPPMSNHDKRDDFLRSRSTQPETDLTCPARPIEMSLRMIFSSDTSIRPSLRCARRRVFGPAATVRPSSAKPVDLTLSRGRWGQPMRAPAASCGDVRRISQEMTQTFRIAALAPLGSTRIITMLDSTSGPRRAGGGSRLQTISTWPGFAPAR